MSKQIKISPGPLRERGLTPSPPPRERQGGQNPTPPPAAPKKPQK